MNTLATSDVVADMNTLGTSDVVSDMNTLATSSNVTNMNTLAGISSNITSGLMHQGKQMMSVNIDKMLGAYMTPLDLQNYKNEEKRKADKQNKQMAIINKWYKRLRKVDGDENITDYFEEKWKYMEDTVTNFLHDNKTESAVIAVISAAYINGILMQEYFEPLISLVEGKNIFTAPQHWIFTPFSLILKQLDVGRILNNCSTFGPL